MMNYDMMIGIGGGGLMFFSWLVSVMLIVALALGIAALWKYINKK